MCPLDSGNKCKKSNFDASVEELKYSFMSLEFKKQETYASPSITPVFWPDSSIDPDIDEWVLYYDKLKEDHSFKDLGKLENFYVQEGDNDAGFVHVPDISKEKDLNESIAV